MRGLAVSMLALGLAVLTTAPARAASQAVWVTAEGHAGAEKGALADAMLQATLMAGARIDAHTATDRGRVVSDVALMRTSGVVLQTRLVSSAHDSRGWTVRIRALVDPSGKVLCGHRRIAVLAEPPRIDVPYSAPAWVEPFAQRLMQRLRSRLAAQPGVTMNPNRVVHPSDLPRGPLDYATLASGRRPLPRGDQHFTAQARFVVDPAGLGKRLVLHLTLGLNGPGGSLERRLTRAVHLNGPALFPTLQALTTPSRRAQEARLASGSEAAVAALAHDLLCTPAAAAVTIHGGRLHIPLGRRQGIVRGDLFVVDSPRASADVLSIATLSEDHATLVPLDRHLSARHFAGLRVRVLGVGR